MVACISNCYLLDRWLLGSRVPLGWVCYKQEARWEPKGMLKNIVMGLKIYTRNLLFGNAHIDSQ